MSASAPGAAGTPPQPAPAQAGEGGAERRASLAVELLAAAHAIALLHAGRSLPAGLDAAGRRYQLAAASRAAAQRFAFDCTRQLGTCQALARRLNRREPKPELAALQWVAISLLLEQPPDPRRADAIVVDQAVEAARTLAGQGAAAFLNATLRSLLRTRGQLLPEVRRDDPVARDNFPRWWIDQLRHDHPQHWQRIVSESDRPGALTLRVNQRRISVDDYAARLKEAGLQAQQIGPWALALARSSDVTRLPGYAEGWFSVQDAGAQLAAPWLAPRAGERILDACAAPGGKAAHLLELADCELLAIDIDRERIGRIEQNLTRLGLGAQVQVADAAQPEAWWDGRPFDSILLDAPCSASGIVRRHPDIRWLRRRSDIATLSALQSRLLDRLWPLLAPGGKLLYATCSIFRAEGEQVIGQFLGRQSQARALSDANGPMVDANDRGAGYESARPHMPGCLLLPHSRQATGVNSEPPPPDAGSASSSPSLGAPSWPLDHDGFFYCLLQKAR